MSNLTSALLILEKRKFAKYEFRNVKVWLLRPNFAELELYLETRVMFRNSNSKVKFSKVQ